MVHSHLLIIREKENSGRRKCRIVCKGKRLGWRSQIKSSFFFFFFLSIMIKWVLGYYYEKEKYSFLGPRKATLCHLVSFSFSGGSVWMDKHGILFFPPLLVSIVLLASSL